MNTYTVTLEPDELKQVYQEGRDRNNRHHTDGSYEGHDGEDAHIKGLKGEVAFAKRYGLEPDLSSQIDGDGGVDFEISCWLGDSLTVDVKATEHYENPWLLVPVDKDDWSDMYVCAAVDGADIKLVGWQSCEEVRSFPASDATGKQTNHILKPADLRQLPAKQMVEPVGVDTDTETASQPDQQEQEQEQSQETETDNLPRSPPAEFAQRTHDNPPEYAKPRIKNTTEMAYLDAIREKEMSRDNPRKQRIEWINQQQQEITE
jgi:hypothetical protein